jgi:hypothetical protein
MDRAIGVHARAGNDLDAFFLKCASVVGITVGIGGIRATTGAHTVTGFRGRAGILVDQLQFRCN